MLWVAVAVTATIVVASASILVATVVAFIGVAGACTGAMEATVLGMTPAIGIVAEPSSMATTCIICRATGMTRAIFTINR